MAPPPAFRRTILDSIGGTVVCGLALSLAVAILARLLVLGHP